MLRIFKRRRTKQISFHTGTKGTAEHSQFIKEVDEKGIKIIHAWTTFGDYSHSHRPQYLNYVITY